LIEYEDAVVVPVPPVVIVVIVALLHVRLSGLPVVFELSSLKSCRLLLDIDPICRGGNLFVGKEVSFGDTTLNLGRACLVGISSAGIACELTTVFCAAGGGMARPNLGIRFELAVLIDTKAGRSGGGGLN